MLMSVGVTMGTVKRLTRCRIIVLGRRIIGHDSSKNLISLDVLILPESRIIFYRGTLAYRMRFARFPSPYFRFSSIF